MPYNPLIGWHTHSCRKGDEFVNISRTPPAAVFIIKTERLRDRFSIDHAIQTRPLNVSFS